jgi:hypothetical protein
MKTLATGQAKRGRAMNNAKTEGLSITVRNAFWSHRRLTGISLILGCFLFLGAAGLIPTDSQGHFITNLPVKEQLLEIPAYMAQLQWSLSLFITGLLVTTLGLALFTSLLHDAGDRMFSVPRKPS